MARRSRANVDQCHASVSIIGVAEEVRLDLGRGVRYPVNPGAACQTGRREPKSPAAHRTDAGLGRRATARSFPTDSPRMAAGRRRAASVPASACAGRKSARSFAACSLSTAAKMSPSAASRANPGSRSRRSTISRVRAIRRSPTRSANTASTWAAWQPRAALSPRWRTSWTCGSRGLKPVRPSPGNAISSSSAPRVRSTTAFETSRSAE